MFNNRRSEIEIIRDILSISNKGAKKTEILYQVNLSFNQLKNYLYYSLENDILEMKMIDNNGRNNKIYQITDKGKKLLSDINKTLSYFE